MKTAKSLLKLMGAALVSATISTQAVAGASLDLAKNLMRADGAYVGDGALIDSIYPPLNIPGVPVPIPMSRLMVQTIPCLGNLDQPLCQNYANTAVTYAGFLIPGRPAPVPGMPIPLPSCTPAAPAAVPFPVGSPVPSPLCAGFQLAEDEAVVVYGTFPPADSYVGLQTMIVERHKDSIPGYPSQVDPLNPAENPAPPANPDRVSIWASVGDTENDLVMSGGPNPDDPSGAPVFAKVITANAEVAQRVESALISAGIPAEAIYIKQIPESHTLTADEYADSFRDVLRVAEPVDPLLLGAWLQSQPLEPFRVTYQGVGFSGYGDEAVHIDRDTGIDQGKGECGIADKWEKFVRNKFGSPDKTTVMNPRIFDDEHCIRTGTYCWGNNNDALYLNAMTKQQDAMEVYDLSGEDSRVVIAGIDHVKSGWARVWNWDIYDGAGTGRAFETFLFSQAAEADYSAEKAEFCDKFPDKCSCAGEEAIDALYWVQLRQSCDSQDEQCIELCSPYAQGSDARVACEAAGPSREIMQRIYLSPNTATGPSLFETRATRIYSYE